MKKVVSVLLLCIIIFIPGCGEKPESPEQTVKNALDALKATDIEKASEYINYDELKQEMLSEGQQSSLETENVIKLIIKNLNYNVISSSIDGNSAKVKTEITNIDMSNVLSELITKAFSFSFTGLSEEELNKKYMETFTELLNNPENKTISKTIEVDLSKNEDKWKVNVNEELTDAIFGGLITYSKKMTNSLGGSSESNDSSKLSEISNWVTSDIWNKGFCDINWYVSDGTSSTGTSLDIDFTLSQLDTAMEKKEDYDRFINGLSDDVYSPVKTVWSKLSPEIDSIYNQIKTKKPVAKDSNTGIDTGIFEQYHSAFSDAVNDL